MYIYFSHFLYWLCRHAPGKSWPLTCFSIWVHLRCINSVWRSSREKCHSHKNQWLGHRFPMNVHVFAVFLARSLLFWFAGVHCRTGINDRAMKTPWSLKSPKKWEQAEGNFTVCMSEYAIIMIKSYVFCGFYLKSSLNSSAAPSKGIWREVSFFGPYNSIIKEKGQTVTIATQYLLHGISG